MSLDAIGIVSQNIAKTIEFYGFLGIELIETGGPDHFEANTSSGLRLMVDSVDLVKKMQPGWQQPQGHGIVLCFKQNTAQDVDILFANLIDAKYKAIKEPWDAFWGQRYSSVEDPDGNQVDIFAPLD